MANLFRNRSYRLLFSATAITNLGDGISALAFPWLATLITRDPVLIAAVAFATRLPWFLMSIPAGAVVDRTDRQRLMVVADLVRLALTLCVVGLVFSIPSFPPPGRETVYVGALAALAFLLGTAEVFRDNAAQTFLPAVVAKADLERANGQLWSVENVMGQFIGPPLAGFLIALAVPAPFLVDAATFALAAVLVRQIRVPKREISAPSPLWDDIAQGWRWMRATPMVLRVALVLGLLNGVSIMGFTMLVLFSQERLGLSAAGHGLLLAAGAAGGVVAGIWGPGLIDRIGRVAALRVALVVFPLSFVILGAATHPIIAGLALFIEAVAALLWNIVTVSWRQRIVPDDLLGRVNSIYRFFGWGLTPLGALLGGYIVATFEPVMGREQALQLPYFAGAAFLVAVALYGIFRIRL